MRRPVLKPALRRVWRDASTLQFGVDPDRAVVIGGLDAPTGRLMERLDGSRDLPGVHAAARELGLDDTRTTRLLHLLHGCGVLEDAAATSRPLVALRAADRERLAPDLAALSLLAAAPDGGAQVLSRRRGLTVAVIGAGRVGATVTALLAAAGVGRLLVDDPGRVQPGDLAPAGPHLGDLGARRDDAARAAVRRYAPSTETARPRPGRRPPALTVLAPVGPLDPGLVPILMRNGTPHLYAGLRDGVGVVGPLVLPGRSSCLRCHDLHRTDRDPAWPRVVAQLVAGPGHPPPSDTVLAAAVAAQAALQVLTYLDGSERSGTSVPAGGRAVEPAGVDPPAAVNGTLELTPPQGRLHRRSWSPHPACDCRAAVG